MDHAAQNFAVLRRICLNLRKVDKATKAGIKNRRPRPGPAMLTALPFYVCDISCDCPCEIEPIANGSTLNEQAHGKGKEGADRSRFPALAYCREPSVWGARPPPAAGALVIGGARPRQTYRRGRRGSRARRPVRIARRRRVHRRLTVRRSRVATTGRRRRPAADFAAVAAKRGRRR